MPVARRTIKGAKYWVIDRRFRGATGEERFRRVSRVQTRPGAEAEERRVIDYWQEHGTIKPLLKAEVKPAPSQETTLKTWDDAVTHFRSITLPKKKPSTRKGYEALLNGPGIKRWAGVTLNEITTEAINRWDTDLIKTGMADSTRRNQHIILRAVLKAVGPKGARWLVPLPEYPTLPKVGDAGVPISRRSRQRRLGHRVSRPQASRAASSLLGHRPGYRGKVPSPSTGRAKASRARRHPFPRRQGTE